MQSLLLYFSLVILLLELVEHLLLSHSHHALVVNRLAVVNVEAAFPYLARDWHDKCATFVLEELFAPIELHRLVVEVREC